MSWTVPFDERFDNSRFIRHSYLVI